MILSTLKIFNYPYAYHKKEGAHHLFLIFLLSSTYPRSSMASLCFSPYSSIVFTYFSNAFPRGE